MSDNKLGASKFFKKKMGAPTAIDSSFNFIDMQKQKSSDNDSVVPLKTSPNASIINLDKLNRYKKEIHKINEYQKQAKLQGEIRKKQEINKVLGKAIFDLPDGVPVLPRNKSIK